MNRRWRQAAALTIVLGSSASVVTAADLPASVRTSATANQQQAAIDTYVKAQIDKIVAKDKAAGAAREELCRQPEPNGTVNPSASFQSTYVASVLSHIGPLLADKGQTGVIPRLNAAIVVARMCVATKQTQLVPMTQQLMADPEAAVSLWGLKGAASLLPEVLRLQLNRNRQTLTASIVDAAKSHPTAGAVIQTAYDALYLPDTVQPPLEAKAFVPCVDAMNQLLAWRVTQYVAAMPAAPQAERIAPVFFIRGPVASVLTPQQQFVVVQNLLDLLSVAAQHTATLPPGDERQQVISLVTNYAGSLNVMFNQQNQQAIADKFQPLMRLRDPIQSANVVKTVADGLAAIRALPAYKSLKDAPTVQ